MSTEYAVRTRRRSPRGLTLAQKLDWFGYAVNGECWEWTAASAPKGYGVVVHEGKRWYAYRAAYTVNHGPIPHGMVVRHRCDNPPCINPDHLEIGTPLDNNNDKIERGRQQRGEDVPNAILTDELVARIRYRYAAGGISRTELAIIHGVSKMAMTDLLNGETWTHVPVLDPPAKSVEYAVRYDDGSTGAPRDRLAAEQFIARVAANGNKHGWRPKPVSVVERDCGEWRPVVVGSGRGPVEEGRQK